MKHVLSQLYQVEALDGKLDMHELNQVELNHVFDQPYPGGFQFDKVYYLTAPQQSFDQLSARRKTYRHTALQDQLLKDEGLHEPWNRIIADRHALTSPRFSTFVDI